MGMNKRDALLRAYVLNARWEFQWTAKRDGRVLAVSHIESNLGLDNATNRRKSANDDAIVTCETTRAI